MRVVTANPAFIIASLIRCRGGGGNQRGQQRRRSINSPGGSREKGFFCWKSFKWSGFWARRDREPLWRAFWIEQLGCSVWLGGIGLSKIGSKQPRHHQQRNRQFNSRISNQLAVQVVLAANDLPSINDVTYSELVEIVSKVKEMKDGREYILGVDAKNLLIVNSGNDLPVIDLSYVSPELAYLSNDADLVVLEGMGRAIETNLYGQFKCDSLKLGMVKHPEVAEFLGGRLYDCVIKYTEVIP